MVLSRFRTPYQPPVIPSIQQAVKDHADTVFVFSPGTVCDPSATVKVSLLKSRGGLDSSRKVTLDVNYSASTFTEKKD